MNGNMKQYFAIYTETDAVGAETLHKVIVRGCDPAQANRKFDNQYNPTKTNRELVAVIEYDHFKEEMFPSLK